MSESFRRSRRNKVLAVQSATTARGCAIAAAVSAVGVALAPRVSQAVQRVENFDANPPNWVGFNNNSPPENPTINFGFRKKVRPVRRAAESPAWGPLAFGTPTRTSMAR
jgi:hypothetical protein